MDALIGFVALAVIAVGAFWGLQFGGPVAQVVTIVITAGLTYSVAYVQERNKYQRELEAKLVSDKRILYKYYLDIIRAYLGGGKKTPKAEDIGPKTQAFFYSAMLNASDDVIRAQNAFLRLTDDDNAHNLAAPAMADVILAMRRDAGLGSSSLTTTDIMRPLINDIDDNLGPFEEWERRRANKP